MDTIPNAASCDSIITLTLTINNSTSSSFSHTACNSYTFNGTTYTSSGVYVDTIPNAAACDSIITLTLTINNSTSSSFSHTACNSYTYNGNTYTASGVYVDTIPNAASCDSIITLTLTINMVNNAVTQSNTLLTATQTGASYQWLDCKTGYSPISGATNKSYTATTSGDYAVAVTLNGCSDTSSCVTVSSIGLTPSPSPVERGAIVVFPNPSNERITIQTSADQTGKALIIYDAIGKVQYRDLWNKGETIRTIDVSSFAKGMYFVRLGEVVTKIVKE